MLSACGDLSSTVWLQCCSGRSSGNTWAEHIPTLYGIATLLTSCQCCLHVVTSAVLCGYSVAAAAPLLLELSTILQYPLLLFASNHLVCPQYASPHIEPYQYTTMYNTDHTICTVLLLSYSLAATCIVVLYLFSLTSSLLTSRWLLTSSTCCVLQCHPWFDHSYKQIGHFCCCRMHALLHNQRIIVRTNVNQSISFLPVVYNMYTPLGDLPLLTMYYPHPHTHTMMLLLGLSRRSSAT